MNAKTRHLLLTYNAITIIFVCVVLLNQRDYQDTWILQDIFIPTVIYILTFSIVVVMIYDNRILTLVCTSFLIVLNAIPNLKYQLFYGTYDSVAHYGFIKNLLSLGFIPHSGFYALTYSDFPGMHIFIASLSLVSGISASASIKFFTSIILGIIPLMVYFVTNRIFEIDVQKYIIIASDLPTVMSYVLSGTVFALPLYFSFFCLLFRRNLLNENGKKCTLALIIFFYSLLFSHALTMLFLILFLSIMLLLLESINFIKKYFRYSLSYMYIRMLLLLMVSFVAWLMFKADFLFGTFIKAIRRIFVGEIIMEPIPARFFEIPLLAQLRFFALSHLKDTLITLLIFGGIFVLIRKFKSKNKYVFSNFYVPLISLLGAISIVMSFQMISRFGEIEYRRFIAYAIIFSPFLVGLFLWHLDRRLNGIFKMTLIRPFTIGLVLFICISLSLIQIFPYQPLVPRANVLSKDLPEDTYVFESRMVNTIYQERMISFAEGFSPGDAKIISDRVTRWQIFGFANESLSSGHTWCSPLEPNTNIRSKQWDISLLHYGDKSGPLNEKVEYRTKEAIEKLRRTLGNCIYDNGESFIISR